MSCAPIPTCEADMRVRHKSPTLVSMWMLDVFCCALGCVTLLFLLNSKMATEEAKANKVALAKLADESEAKRAALAKLATESEAKKAALLDLGTTGRKLAAAVTTLESTRVKLATEEQAREKLAALLTREEKLRLDLSAEADRLRTQLATAVKERDDTARKLGLAREEGKAAQALLDATQLKLNAAEKTAGVTAKELATARAQVVGANDLLKKKKEEIDALVKKAATATTTADDLQQLIKAKDDERLALTKRVAATQKELTAAEAKLRATQKELDTNLATAKAAAKAAAEDLAATKAAAVKTGEELAAARAQLDDLNKKVTDASVTIIDLQGDKRKLADKFDKLQKEVETRFAGIAMTGKKVVFLVDISGSMAKRDLQSPDPSKWPLVVETVCKVMRSIPTLEQYQVIVFSSKARWVFEGGEWEPFTGEKSVAAVKKALLKEKPQEDTNMFVALEKAFTLRASGLDTVYLFSDGLPTSGPGLTAAQQAANPPLTEEQRGVFLGRHVRDTLDTRWNRPQAGKPRVRVNAVGFYFESPDVGAFLWALARDNDGSFVGMSRP